MSDDEKYEGQDHDDGEFHFSEDEDVHYEVEQESTHPAANETEKSTLRPAASRGRKRAMVTAVLFLLVVVAVYKFVAPTGNVPVTAITSAKTIMAQNKSQQNMAPMPKQPAQAMTTIATTAPSAAAASPAMPVPTPSMPAPPPATMTVATTTTTTQPSAMSPPPSMPQRMPVVEAMGQPAGTTMMQPSTPEIANMPAVIPVESAQPALKQAQNVMVNPQITANAAANMANLQAESERAINQIQAQYKQAMQEYGDQTKQLQDQVQTMNTRIATLETELNQLMQALIRQNNGMNTNNATPGAGAPAAPAMQPQATAEFKVPFNVQAIIPGRAWLRADNGETVTVAEGDVIKDLGRIMKIDPYDGVVEVNTGNKVVSLSYGNGA